MSIESIKEKIEELEGFRTDWNIDRESIECIIETVRYMDNIRVLEIGTFNGYSALWFSMVANEVVTLEIEKDRYEESTKNLECAGNVEVLYGNAVETMYKLKEDGRKFNVVLIDGNKSQYMDYLDLAMNLLDENFIIFVDNTISHIDKLGNFFEYLTEHTSLEWKETNLGEGLIVIKKKNL
ncbi:MAG: class I SAM-dependent methyltransferase [Nanoarchaeota archaeon]|nr:class I SAM-dependent methyltransferase [Nanoarchaeota archaeon]